MIQTQADNVVVSTSNTRAPIRNYLYGVGILLLVSMLGLGIFRVYQYKQWHTVALQAIEERNLQNEELKSLKNVKESVTSELERCKNFLSLEEGEFGEFQYCQKFIEWASASL